MKPNSESDRLLVARVAQGDQAAWTDLIERYEGRLLAYVEVRIGRKGASEDIVQETFVGFLRSLPNYDFRRPLENYLFSICAYKLTDYLRKEGRRPTVRLGGTRDSWGSWDHAGSARHASSIARSGERRGIEEQVLATALGNQINKWRSKADWTKLMCIELMFVRGWGNKACAERLKLSEQQVANYKSDFVARTRNLIQREKLPEGVFPELTTSPA